MKNNLIKFCLFFTFTIIVVAKRFDLNKDHFNKRLIGYTCLNLTNIDLHGCARKCFYLTKCLSMNYNRASKACELNAISSSDINTSEFESNTDWNFSDLSVWPEEMAGTCGDRKCGWSQECVPTEPGATCIDLDAFEYITGYLINSNLDEPASNPYLYIATETTVTVTTLAPASSISRFDVVSKTPIRMFLSGETGAADAIEEFAEKGVYIAAFDGCVPLSIISSDEESDSFDVTSVLPTKCLSKHYIVSAFPKHVGYSTFMIIGVKDNTQVLVQLPDGATRQLSLDHLSTYARKGDALSGTIITASSPVVVLSGSSKAEIAYLITRKSAIFHQMPPTESLSKRYVVGNLRSKEKFCITVIAAERERTTELAFILFGKSKTTSSIHYLNGSSIYLKECYARSEVAISIQSNYPVLVSQFPTTSYYIFPNLFIGDPAMTVIRGVDRFYNNYNFNVPEGFTDIACIVIDNKFDISGLQLNDSPLVMNDLDSINVPGLGSFTLIYEEVSDGFHVIRHSNSSAVFGLNIFGAERGYEAYAYAPNPLEGC